jgi:hypothetical protein
VVTSTTDAGQLSDTHLRFPTQQSLLFPSLVKKIDTRKRLSVLEIGSALPETIAFFSQFRCRLQFASMYTDRLLDMQKGDASEAELTEYIASTFAFPKHTSFDICLFWDFLSYLDDKALRAFNAALLPYLHRGTRAHAFTARTLSTAFPHQRYGIREEHLFNIRPPVSEARAGFPNTQATLVNLMSGFDVDQGMLLPDGRLEVLLTASDPDNESD